MSKSSVAHPRSASYNSTKDEVDIEEEPVDTGLIRCICNSSEDDGFTIQCERCLVWQHAYCVRISQNNIPEHYLCDQCERRYGSPSNITTATVTWRDQLEQFSKTVENDVRSVLDKKLRQRAGDFNHNTTIGSSNGLDNGSSNNNNKHHFRDIHNRIGEDEDYKPGRRSLQQNKKNPVGRPPKKPKLSKRIQVSKRSMQELESQDHSNNNSDSGGGGAGSPPRKRRQESSSSNTSSNNGRSDFQRVDHNVIRSKHVKQVFKDARERLARLEKGKGKSVNGTATTTQLPQASTPSPTANQHIVIGDELRKTSGAKASIQSLSKHWQRLTSSLSTATADGVAPITQEKRQGLFADVDIGRNQLVAEVNGDIVLKSEYKFDPGNDFAVLGTPCAHVFFYPTLDLCIDARYRGNDTRKTRRSCHPNAELRSIVVAPHVPEQEIRLGIFTRADIKKGDEITIGWNWQRGHISWKKNLEWHDCGMTDGHQVIDVEEERSSRSALARMLNYFADEFGDCACNDMNLCFIEHLKTIQSGNDESPLTNYKSPSSSRQQGVVRTNGTLTTPSRPEDIQQHSIRSKTINKEASSPIIAQQAPSRQTVISTSDNMINTEYRKKPHAMEVEDNIVIDVVSTSPLVRSPVITAPAKGVFDTEEELDVDGDIDVGDETMNYVPSVSSDSRRRSSSERSLSSGSPLSSLSGSDNEARNQRGGKRARVSSKKDGEKSCKRHSIGGALKLHGDKPSKPKLPCKKAWMRNFMQQATTPAASPPAMTSRDITTPVKSKDETNNPAIKQEQNVLSSNNAENDSTSRHNDTTLQNKDQEKQEATDTPTNKEPESAPGNVSPRRKRTPPPLPPVNDMDIEEDDGELSDASSASTIPIIDRDDDRLMDPPSEEKICEEPDNPLPHSDGTLQQPQKQEKENDQTDESPADKQQLDEPSEIKEQPELPTTSDESLINNPTEESEVSVTQQPVVEQDEGSVATVTKQQLQSSDDTEATSANDSSDEQKPTKVKLSLQEYLARRGTSAQNSVRVAGEEQKSQDCGSKAEGHAWISSSSQVEVTMETRQPGAQ